MYNNYIAMSKSFNEINQVKNKIFLKKQQSFRYQSFCFKASYEAHIKKRSSQSLIKRKTTFSASN